jgi:hypothetical protein
MIVVFVFVSFFWYVDEAVSITKTHTTSRSWIRTWVKVSNLAISALRVAVLYLVGINYENREKEISILLLDWE